MALRIGGYKVCHKWLNDRKGRTLSNEDIAHYQQIVVALKETIGIMANIGELIESHSGWPHAFQSQSGADSKSDAARPRTVEPKAGDRYVTSLPLVRLKVAAGGFSDPQYIEEEEMEWVSAASRHRLR